MLQFPHNILADLLQNLPKFTGPSYHSDFRLEALMPRVRYFALTSFSDDDLQNVSCTILACTPCSKLVSFVLTQSFFKLAAV